MESSYQKFAKDVLVVGTANVLVALSGIVLMPLITRTLGEADYGIWAQVQALISLVMGFVGLGLPYAMSRFLPARTNREEIREDFYSILVPVAIVTLGISILIIAMAPYIAQAFFDGATTIVRISGLMVLTCSVNLVFLSLFRALQQMTRYALFTVVDTCAQIGLIAYLVLNGHGILSMVLAVLTAKVAIFCGLFVLVKRQIGVEWPRFLRLREYLSFSLPTVPSNLSVWVVYSSDRFVIGYYLGTSSVGIYSAAYVLGNLPFLLLGILGLILPPTLSKLYDEGQLDQVKTILSYSLKYSLALAIPFFFGGMVLSRAVLELFSTPDVASKGYTVLILTALSSLVLVFGVIVNLVLILAKKTRISGVAWTIAAVLNLACNITLVPHFGIIGAVTGTLISYVVAQTIQLKYSVKEFTFPIEWGFIAKCLVSSAVMSLAIWAMNPEGPSMTILTVVSGVAIYSVSLMLLKGLRREEFSFFRKLLQGQLRQDVSAPEP